MCNVLVIQKVRALSCLMSFYNFALIVNVYFADFFFHTQQEWYPKIALKDRDTEQTMQRRIIENRPLGEEFR
jgi:hypothetical protein